MLDTFYKPGISIIFPTNSLTQLNVYNLGKFFSFICGISMVVRGAIPLVPLDVCKMPTDEIELGLIDVITQGSVLAMKFHTIVGHVSTLSNEDPIF